MFWCICHGVFASFWGLYSICGRQHGVESHHGRRPLLDVISLVTSVVPLEIGWKPYNGLTEAMCMQLNWYRCFCGRIMGCFKQMITLSYVLYPRNSNWGPLIVIAVGSIGAEQNQNCLSRCLQKGFFWNHLLYYISCHYIHHFVEWSVFYTFVSCSFPTGIDLDSSSTACPQD